ncbi:peptide ABC transporter substrate-binding protein [Paenibacillus monticola]|uniref:Peptide ABC transporter substrate-binding protein n=1 Tax=Paenibacillus monticola TaxID=2666075 RepID=A0A7X2H8Y5_9BACL|nr:peptide ABC transporter substrate-binding protein [Paenibacillus monticola]MRN55038.1 peptide ABC transporter substrate-binding protein [Paenibacillus monticola]
MKRLLPVLLVFGLLLSLNITQGNAVSADPAKQVLRIGFESIPVLLDPSMATDDSTTTVIKGLFEGLVRLNEAGQAVPGIAKDWKISTDGKTYTFNLRSSAKWSNQQQVKASDFEYAWKRALAPEAGNSNAFKMFMIANAETYHNGKLKDSSKVGVKALNNTTLQVTLSEKTSYFIQLLAENTYLPVNALIAKADKKWATQLKTIVTNGPFKLKQWDKDIVTLVKNSNYYAAQEIHFTEVQLLRPKAGTSTTTVAYINNEVDWVGGNELIDYASLDSASTQDMCEFPIGSTYYYQFNLNKAPFNNLKIRKALAMAVDRESIHYGTPAYGFVPWNIPGAKLDFRAEIQDTHYFSEDVVLAKKLLQEGLQEEGFTKLPSFSIIVNANSNHSTIAKSVISSWNKNLGVEATLELQPWAELLDNRYSQNFTMARAGWAADYNDPAAMLEYFTSWSTDNDTGWSNKLYDSYIRKARQTTEPRDRIQAYAKAEKLLIDQMVIIPLYYYVADVLHKSNIENVYVDYDSSVVFARGYLK